MATHEEAETAFEIPFYVALTQRVLIAGVPRTYFYIIGTLCLALSLPMQAPLVGIPLWFVLYIPAMVLSKNDPYFLSVIVRSIKHSVFTGMSGTLEG
jgi:type IV secretory pathway TrbD component